MLKLVQRRVQGQHFGCIGIPALYVRLNIIFSVKMTHMYVS
jgi:hypothetical protein